MLRQADLIVEGYRCFMSWLQSELVEKDSEDGIYCQFFKILIQFNFKNYHFNPTQVTSYARLILNLHEAELNDPNQSAVKYFLDQLADKPTYCYNALKSKLNTPHFEVPSASIQPKSGFTLQDVDSDIVIKIGQLVTLSTPLHWSINNTALIDSIFYFLVNNENTFSARTQKLIYNTLVDIGVNFSDIISFLYIRACNPNTVNTVTPEELLSANNYCWWTLKLLINFSEKIDYTTINSTLEKFFRIYKRIEPYNANSLELTVYLHFKKLFLRIFNHSSTKEYQRVVMRNYFKYLLHENHFIEDFAEDLSLYILKLKKVIAGDRNTSLLDTKLKVELKAKLSVGLFIECQTFMLSEDINRAYRKAFKLMRVLKLINDLQVNINLQEILLLADEKQEATFNIIYARINKHWESLQSLSNLDDHCAALRNIEYLARKIEGLENHVKSSRFYLSQLENAHKLTSNEDKALALLGGLEFKLKSFKKKKTIQRSHSFSVINVQNNVTIKRPRSHSFSSSNHKNKATSTSTLLLFTEKPASKNQTRPRSSSAAKACSSYFETRIRTRSNSQ